jgi:hypothetical protein
LSKLRQNPGNYRLDEMRFGLAPHSGTIFWMRELRSSGQTKVLR